MRLFFGLLGVVVSLLILSGCASSGDLEYNRPADYWYEGMLRDVRSLDLEKADDKFASLSGEHVFSPLIPEAMLLLGEAHMREQEYLLAEFYFKEYQKRFVTEREVDFIDYLILRANFLSFSKEAINQQLLVETIEQAESFLERYPDSRFRPFVGAMMLKLELANRYLNEQAARLYARQDKEEAAQIYRGRTSAWLKEGEARNPSIPWYRQLFNW